MVRGYKTTSEPLELRGIANVQGKNGNMYYYLNVENESGFLSSMFARDSSVFPQGLKKGDKIVVVQEVTQYNRQKQLEVLEVKKV